MCTVVYVTACLFDGHGVLCGVADGGMVCDGLVHCPLYSTELFLSTMA